MGNCFCQNKCDDDKILDKKQDLKKVDLNDKTVKFPNSISELEVSEEKYEPIVVLVEPINLVVPIRVLPTLKRKIIEINVNDQEESEEPGVKRVEFHVEESDTILHQINIQCYTKVALKFPHGVVGVQYDEDHKKFDSCNIDEWVSSLYKNKLWTSWIVYNDASIHLEPGNKSDDSNKSDNLLKSHSTGGHCKGILAWNSTHISWLVHSVPNFPREFTGSTISPIESSEHIYGQSFIHITRQADEIFVKNAIAHIYLMEAHIFMKHNILDVEHPKYMISTISFSEEITHIAKSPKNEIDIYSEYLKIYAKDWYVETWKRGHAINTVSTIKDVTRLSIFGVKYKESQDHSKWATSEQYYWIGDLNRMTSQYKRGGGGFLVKNKEVSLALKTFIVATEVRPVSI